MCQGTLKIMWRLRAVMVIAMSSVMLCDVHTSRPHIVLILADDLGFNDVDWHDPTLHTPRLNKLAHSPHSVILQQAYVNQVCSPTRSALLTGYYPFHLGTQRGVFWWLEPTGVPLQYLFFPERLQSLGYRTHMVGKWHLGYCKQAYLPTRRGLHTFHGFYLGAEDYFKHGLDGYKRGVYLKGYDFWNDSANSSTADWNSFGTYSTDIFGEDGVDIIENHASSDPLFLYLAFQAPHFPLQVPDDYLKFCSHIKRKERQVFCAMMYAVDRAIGRVEDALNECHMLNDTIIIFTTDNGGQTLSGGNNYPLRGNKNTLWEGGTNANTFIYAPRDIHQPAIRDQLFHVVDWYATIMTAAGTKTPRYGDGINQWSMIVNGSRFSPRKQFVYNIDFNSAALRSGKYKLILGNPGHPSGWIRPTENGTTGPPFKQNSWLFNIKADRREKRDLSKRRPLLLHRLKLKLINIAKSAVPSLHRAMDPRGDPKYFNGTFASGWC